jgi:hypothetical protein
MMKNDRSRGITSSPLKKKLHQGHRGWSQVKGKKGRTKTNERALSSDSEDEDDDLLDTPQHRNRGKNLFAYAAGSKYAKEVKALFTEDIEEENDDEKEEEKKGGKTEEKDTDNRKPAAQMTGRKGQKNLNDISGNRDEDDAMEETDDDNTDKAANGEESVFENEEDMKEETDTDNDDVDDKKQDNEEETDNDKEGVSTGDEVTIVKVVKPCKKSKKSQVTEVDKAESMKNIKQGKRQWKKRRQ